MATQQFQYTPEQQAKIDAANKKSVAGSCKQFAKRATVEQCLAKALEAMGVVLNAYYGSPAGPDYPRNVSEAMRELRSTDALIRSVARTASVTSRSAGRVVA